MPKFEAARIEAILKPAKRIAGRLARAKAYANGEGEFRQLGAIVCVEADDGSWVELDAESEAHGINLARNWVHYMNARGASVWLVNDANGRVGRQSVYQVFQPEPEPEYDPMEDFNYVGSRHHY